MPCHVMKRLVCYAQKKLFHFDCLKRKITFSFVIGWGTLSRELKKLDVIEGVVDRNKYLRYLG